jgi:hypothetical protein
VNYSPEFTFLCVLNNTFAGGLLGLVNRVRSTDCHARWNIFICWSAERPSGRIFLFVAFFRWMKAVLEQGTFYLVLTCWSAERPSGTIFLFAGALSALRAESFYTYLPLDEGCVGPASELLELLTC